MSEPGHEQTQSVREAPNAPSTTIAPGESTPTTQQPRGQKRPLATTTLRTAIACRACRDRKTRCSGGQPACAYCTKAGVPCEYIAGAVAAAPPPPDSSSLDEWGHRILEAVGGLAQQLQSSRGAGLAVSAGQAVHGEGDHDSGRDQHYSSEDALDQRRRKRRRTSENTVGRELEIPVPGPSAATGLSSVMAWDTFSNEADALQKLRSDLSALKQRQTPSRQSGLETATCAAPALLALAATFATNYLPAMPIVDMSDVRKLIGEMAEFGTAWNGESCLVLLIAALASMCPKEADDARPAWGTPQLSSPTSSLHSGSAGAERRDPNSLRYWNMARKRLSWALDGCGLLAAQCQFLAGYVP